MNLELSSDKTKSKSPLSLSSFSHLYFRRPKQKQTLRAVCGAVPCRGGLKNGNRTGSESLSEHGTAWIQETHRLTRVSIKYVIVTKVGHQTWLILKNNNRSKNANT